jgi:hypothetical protein
MGTELGSDARFGAAYDVQPPTLALLAVSLLFLRVLARRSAFHDQENRHGNEG